MDKCKNILIIEDDAAVRQMLRDVLEIHGYHVETATDGQEGVEKLKAFDQGMCLVLLDLMMPGVNGWQFLDVHRNDPSLAKIPVVICSAYKESARSIRPAAIIEKPIQLERLLGTVKSFCA